MSDRFEPCATVEPGQIRRRVKGWRDHWCARVLSVSDGVVACEDVMQWGVGPTRHHPLEWFAAAYPDVWLAPPERADE